MLKVTSQSLAPEFNIAPCFPQKTKKKAFTLMDHQFTSLAFRKTCKQPGLDHSLQDSYRQRLTIQGRSTGNKDDRIGDVDFSVTRMGSKPSGQTFRSYHTIHTRVDHVKKGPFIQEPYRGQPRCNSTKSYYGIITDNSHLEPRVSGEDTIFVQGQDDQWLKICRAEQRR